MENDGLFKLSKEHEEVYSILKKIPSNARSDFIYNAIITKYNERVRVDKIKEVLYKIIIEGEEINEAVLSATLEVDDLIKVVNSLSNLAGNENFKYILDNLIDSNPILFLSDR